MNTDYFDEQLGPALRAAIVTPLFRNDPDLALRVPKPLPEEVGKSRRNPERGFWCTEDGRQSSSPGGSGSWTSTSST